MFGISFKEFKSLFFYYIYIKKKKSVIFIKIYLISNQQFLEHLKLFFKFDTTQLKIISANYP